MQLVSPLLLCCVPVLSLTFSAAVFSVALHCSNQRHRLYLLPFFIIFSIFSFTASKYFWFIPSLVSLWSQGVSLYILHIISLLHIEKWPVPYFSAQLSTQQYTASNRQRYFDLRATYKLWGNPQLLPQMIAPNAHSPPEAQPYSVFFFLRLIKLPIYYYLHSYVIPSLFSETIVEIFPEDVSPVQQTLLRRFQEVTAREIVIRGYTATVWILESLIFLDGANAILACFFVTVGIDHPSEWPALFGSPISATSLRKFWSRFWHKLAVRPFTNYGKVVAHSLGLQPESFAFKTIVACVVFGLSGISHSAVSWQLGQRDWYLDIWWFFLNFLSCLVEVMCLSAMRSFAKSMRWSRELKIIEDSWFGKLIGIAWVFGFFLWSTPKWKYPGIYRAALEEARWRSILSKMSVVPA